MVLFKLHRGGTMGNLSICSACDPWLHAGLAYSSAPSSATAVYQDLPLTGTKMLQTLSRTASSSSEHSPTQAAQAPAGSPSVGR